MKYIDSVIIGIIGAFVAFGLNLEAGGIVFFLEFMFYISICGFVNAKFFNDTTPKK